jgi:hypothetical protein
MKQVLVGVGILVTVALLVIGYLAVVGMNDRIEAVSRAAQTDRAGEATVVAASAFKTHFLVIGKGKIADPQKQQERAVIAVQKIAEAVKSSHSEAIVDSLAEHVMTKEQYRRGEANEKVTGAVFRERLKRLAETATPRDSVVIYTHSHGRKRGFEEQQPLGGIVLDLPVRRPEHAGTLLWDEYADLLLKIPAKNVVVLTMSCFSGGLVEHLNSPRVKERWKDRRRKEGRNLIVLTSQNKDLVSPPIVKDGEVINPFTLAVAKAFAWEADGFELRGGKAATTGRRDGKLTVGELIDYILYGTENVSSEAPRRRNIAKPQLTGSFNRGDVLFERIEATISNTPNGNTAQQGASVDADKPRR